MKCFEKIVLQYLLDLSLDTNQTEALKTMKIQV